MTPAAYVLDIETIPEGLAFGETIEIPEKFAGLDDPGEAERLYLRQALHPRRCQVIAWALIPLLGGDTIVQIGPDEDGLLDALAAFPHLYPGAEVEATSSAPSTPFLSHTRSWRERPAPLAQPDRPHRPYYLHTDRAWGCCCC